MYSYLIDCNFMFLPLCLNRVNGCKCKALSSPILKKTCPFYKEKVNEKKESEQDFIQRKNDYENI